MTQLEQIYSAAFQDELEKIAKPRKLTQYLLKTNKRYRGRVQEALATKDPLDQGLVNVLRKKLVHPEGPYKPSLHQMITHRVRLQRMNRPVSLIPKRNRMGVDVTAFTMKKKPVGTLNVDLGSKAYRPQRIIVNEPYRRKGIATALHRKAGQQHYQLLSHASSYHPAGEALTRNMIKTKAVGFKSVPGLIS